MKERTKLVILVACCVLYFVVSGATTAYCDNKHPELPDADYSCELMGAFWPLTVPYAIGEWLWDSGVL